MFKKFTEKPVFDFKRELSGESRRKAACINASLKTIQDKHNASNEQLFRAAWILASAWLMMPLSELLEDMLWAWSVLGQPNPYPTK
jgi:hypothetical protein